MIVEHYEGKEVRFIEKDGTYWAVAKDVASILGFRDTFNATKYLPNHVCNTIKGRVTSNKKYSRKYHNYTVISEKGIYRLIMRSNKPEAAAFQDWVCDVLVELRKSMHLTPTQAFQLMDKQHQKKAMEVLQTELESTSTVSYIKANTIANKCVSTLFGYSKMIGKEAMNEDMLNVRQQILDDCIEIMTMKEKYNLNISISKTLYNKYLEQQETA